MERRYFNIRQTTADDKHFIEGHVARFNEESEDLGGFTEVIRKGAFSRTLADSREIKAFFNHDESKVLGTTRSGTLKLWEDGQGLALRLEVPDTTVGRDLVTLVQRGDLPGCSFGFMPDEESIRWVAERDGMLPLREVNNLQLFEVSVGVTYPAYEAAEAHVALRSLNTLRSNRDLYMRRIRLMELEDD